MHTEPQKEHQWLQRMVGEWTIETEASMEPGAPPMTYRGTERARSLGGLWVICEGEGDTPGGTSHNIITLGYDVDRKRFVGTFVGSTMTYMWVYEGHMDPSGQKIVLDTEGPSFTEMGRMGKYRDTFEIVSDDHRTLSSSYQDQEGQWHRFMTSHYRRVK
ncbi:MAG TPA: DUF1579 domain-containing protein [Longimicrobium sp.]|nr:DUF1579 domain-containing protein [Longimicrobium sp.]